MSEWLLSPDVQGRDGGALAEWAYVSQLIGRGFESQIKRGISLGKIALIFGKYSWNASGMLICST